MSKRNQYTTRHWAAGLPGWMFLASGIALMGMAVLTQPWLDCRQLQWQHDIMQLQASQLAKQKQAYGQFHQALKSQNLVLLERLAYHQMRLKPAGSRTLTPIKLGQNQTIEGWLHTPLPRVGIDYPALDPARSKLVRISTGSTRLPLMAVGILSVTAALLWAGGRS